MAEMGSRVAVTLIWLERGRKRNGSIRVYEGEICHLVTVESNCRERAASPLFLPDLAILRPR